MFSLCVSNYLRIQILDIQYTELLKSFNFDYHRGYSVPSKRCCYRQGHLGARFKLLIFATKLLLKLIKITLHVHGRQICIFPSSLNKMVSHSVLTCTENLASHTDTGQTLLPSERQVSRVVSLDLRYKQTSKVRTLVLPTCTNF